MFREPQIDAWYVAGGGRVLPLDEDAGRAVGGGVSLAAYRERVVRAYGDKLPGSAYAKSGKAGGYSAEAGSAGAGGAVPLSAGPGPAVPLAAGAGVLAGVLVVGAGAVARARRSG
ncbi:hypothetical protein EES41_10615 [Streptomyces sp. ADI95-16]|nr:hypothetical protein EES41_10615 [Streptomyces sp. ADI95-16]